MRIRNIEAPSLSVQRNKIIDDKIIYLRLHRTAIFESYFYIFIIKEELEYILCPYENVEPCVLRFDLRPFQI